MIVGVFDVRALSVNLSVIVRKSVVVFQLIIVASGPRMRVAYCTIAYTWKLSAQFLSDDYGYSR